MKRTPFRSKPSPPMKRSRMRRKSKSPTSKLQKKCDNLLTPIVKKLHPKCLLCRKPTQVAHHHVHKSKSLALRYDLDNLINLCNSCHFALHQNESYYASKIVKIKGMEWFEELEWKKNRLLVDGGVGFYEENYKRLKELEK